MELPQPQTLPNSLAFRLAARRIPHFRGVMIELAKNRGDEFEAAGIDLDSFHHHHPMSQAGNR